MMNKIGLEICPILSIVVQWLRKTKLLKMASFGKMESTISEIDVNVFSNIRPAILIY